MKPSAYRGAAVKDYLIEVRVRNGPQAPDARIEQQEERAVLLWAIAKLTPRERAVIDMRFGITREPMTFDAVGKEIGTSTSRVGQLEKKALRRLKASMKRRRADLKSRDL